MTRGAKQEITCACGCGRTKMVRVADIKRGWGKFYDKSCKGRGVDGFKKGVNDLDIPLTEEEKAEILEAKRKRDREEAMQTHWCAECDMVKVDSRGELCTDCYFYATEHPFSSEALGQD